MYVVCVGMVAGLVSCNVEFTYGAVTQKNRKLSLIALGTKALPLAVKQTLRYDEVKSKIPMDWRPLEQYCIYTYL